MCQLTQSKGMVSRVLGFEISLGSPMTVCGAVTEKVAGVMKIEVNLMASMFWEQKNSEVCVRDSRPICEPKDRMLPKQTFLKCF